MFEKRFFILAPNYHGSTLLAKLLSSHPAIAALGDTYPTNEFDQICGCGALVSQCAFWQSVKSRVGATRYQRLVTMMPLYPKHSATQWKNRLYRAAPSMLRRLVTGEAELRTFVNDDDNFLAAVFDSYGKPSATVFVDGVKSILRVEELLACRQPVDGIIHLVRNPGDYVKSCQKQSRRPGLGQVARDALLWRLYHALAERLGQSVPYHRLTYEGLSSDPGQELARLYDFVGVQPIETSSDQPDASTPWHFMGNASLFNFTGAVVRSSYSLSTMERLLVGLIGGSAPQRQIGQARA